MGLYQKKIYARDSSSAGFNGADCEEDENQMQIPRSARNDSVWVLLRYQILWRTWSKYSLRSE